MIALCPGHVWWSSVYPPWESSASSDPAPKIASDNAVNRWWAVDYSISPKNFVWSLNAWHPKWFRSSRSRGQRSRSQRNITCAKIRKIINNSAGDCSISLKFSTTFDHVTLSSSTGERSRSQLDITYRISCWRLNLVKIIPEPNATIKRYSRL